MQGANLLSLQSFYLTIGSKSQGFECNDCTCNMSNNRNPYRGMFLNAKLMAVHTLIMTPDSMAIQSDLLTL